METMFVHPDERALIDRVKDDPLGRGPRLVYADWLEEFGNRAELAEFIRLDLSREVGGPRHQELWRRYGGQWLMSYWSTRTAVMHAGFLNADWKRPTSFQVGNHAEALPWVVGHRFLIVTPDDLQAFLARVSQDREFTREVSVLLLRQTRPRLPIQSVLRTLNRLHRPAYPTLRRVVVWTHTDNYQVPADARRLADESPWRGQAEIVLADGVGQDSLDALTKAAA